MKGRKITMEYKLIVSSSPHIHNEEAVSDIMLDVIIALLPAAFMGTFYFGYRALIVLLTAVAACMASEYFYEKLMGKKVTVNDLSAALTGLLLGLNMPPAVELWQVIIGSVFAIVLVKQLYGGIGKNFVNPALAARCFMVVSWAGTMTKFPNPLTSADSISSATPLAILNGTSDGIIPTVFETFVGKTAGSIGETSAIMLIIGFVYLLVRGVVKCRIPLACILSFVVLTALFGRNVHNIETLKYVLLQVFSGGFLLGAFFMATDYTTTPTTKSGQIIFGIGCGVITFVIRNFGGYPEGVSFAILLMNLVTPLIDRYTIPKSFGEVKKNA